jgi:hypothetical protein
MEAIVNEKRVVRGARLGKIATALGLGFLAAGLVVSLSMKESPILWLSFGFLLVGILVSSVGTLNMNRWVREPRADQSLAQALKGFDDRYRLYSYVLPAPHVLLSPLGLFVLTAMGQDGAIRLEGGRFHRGMTAGRILRFMADEGLGKPLAEGDDQVRALQQYLGEHGVDGDVDIQNVLVFYNPGVQLEVSDPPRPVIIPKALKRVIRKQAGAGLPTAKQGELRELFEAEIG